MSDMGRAHVPALLMVTLCADAVEFVVGPWEIRGLRPTTTTSGLVKIDTARLGATTLKTSRYRGRNIVAHRCTKAAVLGERPIRHWCASTRLGAWPGL